LADTSRYLPIQNVEDQEGPFYFRYDEFGADTLAMAHSHTWGHLNYAAHGTLQMETEGLRFLSPPQYAVWIPPHVMHGCTLRHAIVYRSIYIAPGLCGQLPAEPCTVRISPIIRSVLADFAARDVHVPATPADLRLAHVVVDQLAVAEVQRSYLPAAASPALATLLEALQAEPGDHRSLAEWARARAHDRAHAGAQVPARAGHVFRRLAAAAALLRTIDARSGPHGAGDRVRLGYSTASAFIAMFQREAGT
jgi:hypothetical protein